MQGKRNEFEEDGCGPAKSSPPDPCDPTDLTGCPTTIERCFALAPAAVYIRDMDGRYVSTNRRWHELTGLSPEAARGKRPCELFPKPVAESAWQLDEQVRRDGQAVSAEEVLETPQGLRTLLSVQFPLHDAAGKPHAVCGFSIDVTNQKQLDASLQRSESRFRSLAEAIPDVLLRIDRDMRIGYVSPAIERYQTASAEELTGATLARCDLAPTLLEALTSRISTAMTSARPVHETVAAPTTLGQRWFDLRIIPEPEADGQINTCILLCRDITESHTAQETLRTRDSELARAQALAHVGTWTLDIATDRADWSKEMFRIFGIEERPVGLTREELRRLVVEDDVPRLQAASKKAINDGIGYELEIAIRRPDGEKRHVITRAEAVRDTHGTIVQLVGSIQDVTEWRRADLARQEMARRVQESLKFESLGMLAGGIAHEFNNLLVTILGNADLIMRDIPDDPAVQESLQDIREAALRASDLSSQMLDYSGRGTFSIRPTDLNRQIEQVAALLHGSISRNISVERSLEPALPLVAADPAQLTQVITEVLTNAVEASELRRPGRIEIITQCIELKASASHTYLCDALKPGRYVSMHIRDNGKGMDEETQQRAFDPFFTTKFTGRGLGLGSVLGIVRGHGGGIRLHSVADEGTDVEIVLPLASKQEAPHVKRTTDQDTSDTIGHGRVLVVDDQSAVLSSTQRMVEHLGFDVIAVGTGLDAIDALADDPLAFRVAIVDLLMPGLDGHRTAAELRRLCPGLPLVLTSGYPPAERDRSFDIPGDGPVQFLKKPFDRQNLETVIRTCLA